MLKPGWFSNQMSLLQKISLDDSQDFEDFDEYGGFDFQTPKEEGSGNSVIEDDDFEE